MQPRNLGHSPSPSSHLAGGFALAVQPVTASTITTDTEGIAASEVTIPAADRGLPAYRAMPDKGARFPVLLVVQEVFGVHEHIRDVCRRLAKLGYLAVSVELYARLGDVSKLTDIQEILNNYVYKTPDAQVMSDLDAAVEWADQNQGDTSRLGITGFCWGGRIVWLYAAHNASLKAAVAWYGRLTGPQSPTGPKHPLDLVAELKAPVLGLYGGQDPSIPLADVEKMREALRAHHNPSEIVVYPDAGHAFFADYRPNYREAAAKDGWQRLQAWFKQHGVA